MSGLVLRVDGARAVVIPARRDEARLDVAEMVEMVEISLPGDRNRRVIAFARAGQGEGRQIVHAGVDCHQFERHGDLVERPPISAVWLVVAAV